jgi:hypothetical protein
VELKNYAVAFSFRDVLLVRLLSAGTSFRALLDGQHMIRGFSNPDIRDKLKDSPHLKNITGPCRQSAKVTRIFNRCHAHGLIAKIPHSRRWRLTKHGRVAMTASIQLREVQFPITHIKLTA